MSMLCTNWGNMSIFDNTTSFFSNGSSSYGVKMFAEWFTVAVFLFSMVGPLLFPNRDFGTN
jgi:hypothetical protein